MPDAGELSFARVVALLEELIGGRTVYVGFHGAFWRGKTRDEFVATGPISNVTPVVPGDSEASGIIHALRGTGPFDPETGRIPQMPPFGPNLAEDSIAVLARWIDAGCPE